MGCYLLPAAAPPSPAVRGVIGSRRGISRRGSTVAVGTDVAQPQQPLTEELDKHDQERPCVARSSIRPCPSDLNRIAPMACKMQQKDIGFCGCAPKPLGQFAV
jgi:hypothetical protein